jgi:hypothetical protein
MSPQVDALGVQLTQQMLMMVLRRTSSVRLLRTLEFLVYRQLTFAAARHRGVEWSRSMMPAALTGS